MSRKLLPFLLLAATSSAAFAIVIRDDVDDAQYRVPDTEFPALVDMPGEGHGVLIAPQWAVTAAHTIPMQGGKPAPLAQVRIGGRDRAVERVVIHPGQKSPPQGMIEQALRTGDGILAVMAIASSDDIALIKLKQPVADIAPVPIHTGSGEIGQTVKIIGKGATGTGVTGLGTGGRTVPNCAGRSTRSPARTSAGFAMSSIRRPRLCRSKARPAAAIAAARR
jgi:hypothetical protein